ncbi:hypothetical protein HPB49_023054 [Dermacentor silvarum]|uniref:Uncharacterized protein n=1 Tax=Dermacentor silvarum TaxID=543639 RepID=A0ACB8CMV9_DERSI|nr:hypothetical protein HPB49_023054 [Dermacentor silvarum]
MEDKRSPIDDPPQKVSSQYDLPAPEQLGGKPEADMGASKSNREKLDQKGAGAADVSVGKHLEQPVDIKAPRKIQNHNAKDIMILYADKAVSAQQASSKLLLMQEIQRQKLGHKETGATEIPDGKRYENALEPVDTMAQERRRAEEADRAQSIPLVVPSAVPKLKQLLKKRRKSALDNKALQELLRGNPHQAPSSTLPTNEIPCTRVHYVACVLFFVVVMVMGVVVLLPSMRSPRACDTTVCRYYAKLLEDTLSNTVSPCIDFHAHVCAGWERSHGISVMDNVYERFIERVAEKVSTTTTPSEGQTAVQKAALLFQSCRNIYTGRRSELELVKERLLDFGIFWPEMTNKSSVLRIMFSIGAAWNWGSFIHISTWHPGRLTITPTLYFNHTLQRRHAMLSQMKRGNSYQKYFDKMVEAFGRAEGQVLSYKELTDLESVVLPVITEQYNAVPWSTLENVGLDELKALAMGSIPNDTWDEELSIHFNATPNGDYVFTIANVEFLKAFFGLVMSEGEPKMAYYMGWATVQPASLLSNAELVNYFYQTEADAITGHSRFCVYLCHVYMGLPFYASYMRTLVTPLIIQDVSALIRAVSKSLRARLEEATPAWSNLDAVLPVFDGNDQAEVSSALNLFTEATDGHLNKLYERFPDMTPSTITNLELITIARRLTVANTEMARFHDSEGSLLLLP